MTSTTLRIRRDLFDAVNEAAKDRCISRNVLIEALLESALPRLVPADELKLTRD